MRFERRHWELLCSAPLSSGDVSDASDPRPVGEDRQILRDVERAGLASGRTGEGPGSSDRRKLYRFAAVHGLVVDVFRVPGGSLAAANLDLGDGRRSVTASGKGFDAARAVLACLGEAVETKSWIYRPADREGLVGVSQADGRPMLRAERVLGFSTSQIRRRVRHNSRWDGWDSVPPARQMRIPDLWATVRNVDGSRAALCPAFLCYGWFGEVASGDSSLNIDSNGCAAGSAPLQARSRAVLEIAERDATGVWWWRGCLRDRLPRGLLDDPELNEALAEHASETGRHVWFLDISTFSNAHVVAALSCEKDGRRIAAGFAAAFGARDAVRSAFLEMIQTELALDAHEIRSAREQPVSGADLRLAAWLREADIGRLDFLPGRDDEASTGLPDQAGGLPGLIEEMSAAVGEDVWFADLSRPEFGVSVVKAICPGLAHFKPRWGNDRLWSLPGERGWPTAFDRRGLGARPPLP